MDDLGYHAVWTAEHHFQLRVLSPNLVQAQLGSPPKRSASSLAAFNVADVASDPAGRGLRDGRSIVTDGASSGVGRGYHTREVETSVVRRSTPTRTANTESSPAHARLLQL
jgi:hypothetical protein